MAEAPKRVSEAEVLKDLEYEVRRRGGAFDWGQRYGIQASEVSNVLQGRMHPTLAILVALGYRKVVEYEIIPDEGGDE